jgi:hypothetical protein
VEGKGEEWKYNGEGEFAQSILYAERNYHNEMPLLVYINSKIK